MNFFEIFFNLFLQSDFFSKILVILLLLCIFLLLVFFIYGYMKLSYKTKSLKIIFDKVHSDLSLSEQDGALVSFLQQVKTYALEAREEVFFLMVDDFLISEQRLKLLFGVFASVGPLIGLLGTIWGIVDVFLNLEGTADLAVIAPGIAEGLITTAAGLFLAIPALCFYHLFSYLIEQYYRLTCSLYYLFWEKEKRMELK
jgi:biopolymer transport protein ExbB/TolQ